MAFRRQGVQDAGHILSFETGFKERLATEVEEEDIENLKKLGVKVVEADTDTDTSKKKFAFLVPAAAAVWAVLPTTATVVGAGVIGVVGGAASIVGGKLVNKIWK